MKYMIPTFICALLVFFSIPSFAISSGSVKRVTIRRVHKENYFIRHLATKKYKVQIKVVQTDHNSDGYNYEIHANVYDADNNPVSIPGTVTVYGNLTLKGDATSVSIIIPSAGAATGIRTHIE